MSEAREIAEHQLEMAIKDGCGAKQGYTFR